MKTKTTIHLSILCLIIMSITFIISAEADTGNDGTVNRAWHFTYDANGKPAKGEFDMDGDGSPNKVWHYTYDAIGKLSTQELDRDNDGTIELVCTTRTIQSVN